MASAAQRLIELIWEAFRAGGADFDAGRGTYALLADAGWQPQLPAEVVALPPAHPYLRFPLQFAGVGSSCVAQGCVLAAARDVRRGVAHAAERVWQLHGCPQLPLPLQLGNPDAARYGGIASAS